MRQIYIKMAAVLLLAGCVFLARRTYSAGLAKPASTKAGLGVSHVLLISIDGMHAVDFINCANGISGVNGGQPYCPNLASLKTTGYDYLYASTSRPSDSFPGLTALVSGGTPRVEGAYYDVAYDRSLDPPTITTGYGLLGGLCLPYAVPTGTSTEFDEGIDINQNKLNGGAPPGEDGGILARWWAADRGPCGPAAHRPRRRRWRSGHAYRTTAAA